MKTKLINYIKAAYAGLYVVSHEEGRIEAIVRDVTESLNRIVTDSPPCPPSRTPARTRSRSSTVQSTAS